MVTKATFVGEGFTRKPPKYERFVRPMGLRFTKVCVSMVLCKHACCYADNQPSRIRCGPIVVVPCNRALCYGSAQSDLFVQGRDVNALNSY